MTTQQMLDERYGRVRTRRRTAGIVAGIALAAVFFGGLAWMTVGAAVDAVDADTTGFTVVDARTVALDFQVTAPLGRTVACVLEAQDEEHGVVGWRVVELPASTTPSQAFREVIPTTAEATTGLVNTCWVT